MKIDITNLHRRLSRKIRVALFGGLLALAGWGTAGAEIPEPKTDLLLTAGQLRQLPKDEVLVVDTRSSWKFLLGHIPGSVHLGDWREFTRKVNGVKGLLIEDKRFIVDKLKPLGFHPDKTIVFYGDSRDQWRTDGRFLWMMDRFGFPSVKLLRGGYDGWKQSGADTKIGRGRKPVPSSLTEEHIQFQDHVSADKDWILERLESDTLAVIDTRTRKEYLGATPYGSKRGGRIPKAAHIPWQAFFTEEGNLKPLDSLHAVLREHEIDPEKEIVVYCTGGVRSGMSYWVFKYLGYKVRNYDGSWWDWSHHDALPIETSG